MKTTRICDLEKYLDSIGEKGNEFYSVKSGDRIKFVSKSDKNYIINAEILKIDNDGMRIYFQDIDYPNVGIQNMTEYSISKYWNIK